MDISTFRSLYPFKSNYLIRNGLKYHYLDEGEGEPIVMVHGNPTWSFFYRFLVKELSPHYRIIAPDHIGCGLSDKPDTKSYDFRLQSRVNDFEALCDHLNINDNITLVLHDWGGPIGLSYAVKYPERISRLIIMNTSGFLLPKGKRLPLVLWLIRNVRALSIPAVLYFNLFAKGALLLASRKHLAGDIKKGFTAPYNCRRNRLAILKFVQDIPLKNTDPSYNLIKTMDKKLKCLNKIPMLLCWGYHDFVFDMLILNEWQRRFPHAVVKVIYEAGHYLLEDAAEKVGGFVGEFMQQYSNKNDPAGMPIKSL